MKRSPSRYTTTSKRDKIPQTKRNLLVHMVELSTAVVKVDIKVINVSLPQKQCLQCVTAALMHVEIPRQRDASRQLGFLYSHILSAIDLQCHVFPFEKLFVKCPSLSVNGIFDNVISDVIFTY